jgi:hypothetical protein
MISISPALMNDLYKILKSYSFEVVTANGNKNNHRYIFTNQIHKLLIELSDFKK